MNYSEIQKILGDQAEFLLDFKSKTFKDIEFTKPSGNIIDSVFSHSDRSNNVLRNLQSLYSHGHLKNTGYLSILPVDQGIEHSAGASFSDNPSYFDPENIVKLAIEAECSGVASTLGALGLVSRKYAHKIPFIVKLNHNELLSYPNKHDQVKFAQVRQAFDMGAAGVGATIYFGSMESSRQIQEISEAFARAHELGMFTMLWCYTRNQSFKKYKEDYHTAADLTGQANHIGVTIQADIIKQKMPTTNKGYPALNSQSMSYGKFDEKMYTELSSEHPIDLTKYQVANCYLGKIPLINSGGASVENDLMAAVAIAVINKRAGGSGLVLGRKAFERPTKEGVELLRAVQDVYLCKEVDIA
jgi:class I fructose-bisphosphate aldolase